MLSDPNANFMVAVLSARPISPPLCAVCRDILLFLFFASWLLWQFDMAAPRSVHRLQQTLSHVKPPSELQWSIVAGPTQPRLLDITLGELLTLQALQYGDYECLVFPWTGARWTYADLNDETDRVARGMLAMGIQKGDRIGIMAGNCEQYISVFFAAARVGAILVVLNNTYTPSELYYALNHSGTVDDVNPRPHFPALWLTTPRPLNRVSFAIYDSEYRAPSIGRSASRVGTSTPGEWNIAVAGGDCYFAR